MIVIDQTKLLTKQHRCVVSFSKNSIKKLIPQLPIVVAEKKLQVFLKSYGVGFYFIQPYNHVANMFEFINSALTIPLLVELFMHKIEEYPQIGKEVLKKISKICSRCYSN